MKALRIIALFLALYCMSNAVLYSQTVGDTAWLECTYDYCWLRDTSSLMSADGVLLSGDSLHIVRDTMLLQIGNKASRFYEYSTFYRDSLIAAFRNLTGTGLGRRVSDAVFMVYKDKLSGQCVMTDLIGVSPFMVIESSPVFEWRIEDEWKEMAGYRVRKAVCTFRGRNYVAWFAPELPVSDGPWKFCGLPGLIFEVYDEPCEYRYSLIGLRMVERDISIPDENYMETDLDKYYRTKKRAIEDPALYLDATYSGRVIYQNTEGEPIDPSVMVNKMRYDFQEIM